MGKWHLKWPKPKAAGFDDVTYFESNGPHYDRKVVERGRPTVAKGYIEDYLAGQSVRFIERAAAAGKPFVLHHATQIPHMDHRFSWPARPETLARYPLDGGVTVYGEHITLAVAVANTVVWAGIFATAAAVFYSRSTARQ